MDNRNKVGKARKDRSAAFTGKDKGLLGLVLAEAAGLLKVRPEHTVSWDRKSSSVIPPHIGAKQKGKGKKIIQCPEYLTLRDRNIASGKWPASTM